MNFWLIFSSLFALAATSLRCCVVLGMHVNMLITIRDKGKNWDWDSTNEVLEMLICHLVNSKYERRGSEIVKTSSK